MVKLNAEKLKSRFIGNVKKLKFNDDNLKKSALLMIYSRLPI